MIPFLPPGQPQFEVDRFLDFAFSKMNITQEEFVSTQEELELKGTSRQIFTQLYFFFKETYTAEMKAHFFRVLQEKEGFDASVLKYLRIRQFIDSSFGLLAELYSTLKTVVMTGDGTTSMTQNTPREVLFRAVCPTREIHEQMLYYSSSFLLKVKDELDNLEQVVDSIEEKDSKITMAVAQNLVMYFTRVVRQQFYHPEISWPSVEKYFIKDKLEVYEAANRKILQVEFLRYSRMIFSIKALYKSCGIL